MLEAIAVDYIARVMGWQFVPQTLNANVLWQIGFLDKDNVPVNNITNLHVFIIKAVIQDNGGSVHINLH